MLDLNEFVTFAAVADSGSFSRAAQKLDVSKALVSKHIADLEHTLGVKLLNRTTRKLGLTAAGAIFYQRCQQLIAHADGARHELEQFRSAPGGLIKVSASISFGRLHLVPAIARFLARYPSVSIELELSEKFADLITGDADIVVRQAEEPRLLSFVARKLAPLRQIVCATPSYLRQHPMPRTPDDLIQHNCIVRTANLRNEWIFRQEEQLLPVRVKGNFKANNADGVLEAVLGDVGIGAMPSMVAAEHIRGGRLVMLLPEYRLPDLVLYAAYLPNPTMSQCVQIFVAFLCSEFGNAPYWDRGLGFAPDPA
jgi:DNA-binding transcriptional LysR family regulator